MCGIFGFVSNQDIGQSDARETLFRGVGALKHRGPDGSNFWVSPNGRVGLGHARLSVVDLKGGTQPAASHDGRYVAVFNGEIYNYKELRQELGSKSFRTNSDVEVLLRAFEEWGNECLARFRGMFSLAIWDNFHRKIFLARDRSGIKPLYWVSDQLGLYFASEIKALTPFVSQRRINGPALSNYLTYQFYLDDRTLLHGVNQFPAASYALSGAGEILEPRHYWRPSYEIDTIHSEKWFTERISELIKDSIDVHLQADVEVGSYLSGGLDSSIVVSLASESKHEHPLNVYNGRFNEGADYDESPYAIALAEEKNIRLHIIDISDQDFIDHISDVIWHLDQPIAGPGAFPQYMVAKHAANDVKVLLCGQGGDELFAGYARYLVAYFEQCIRGAIDGTLDNGSYVVRYESIIPNLVSLQAYKALIQQQWSSDFFGGFDERYWRLINRSLNLMNFLNPNVIDNEKEFLEFKGKFWIDPETKTSYLDLMTRFDLHSLLPALLHVEDRMSMAHGIESRVPFLDNPLVEFVGTIPADIKFKDGELKRMLKRAFSASLPSKILNRKDKMGFPVPLNKWIRDGSPVRSYIGDVLGSAKARTRPYLSDTFSIDDVLRGQGAHDRDLWALLSLEIWQQQYID